MNYALRLLDKDELYLAELGDRFIKLAVQFVVRHLNWVMDKINEKRTMSTDRVLYILEDLGKLQSEVRGRLFSCIGERVAEVQPGIESLIISQRYLDPLMKELDTRFDHLFEPCLSSLATRIS